MAIDIKTNLPTSYDSQIDSTDDGNNTSGVLPQTALAPPTTGSSTSATSSASAISGIAHAKTDKLSASNVASFATLGLGISPSENKLPVPGNYDAAGKLIPESKESKANVLAVVNTAISAGGGSPSKYIEESRQVFENPAPSSTQTSWSGSRGVGDINSQAMQILQEAGFKSEKTDMTMNNAANKNVMDQQMTQAKTLQEQVKGEQKSAVFKLVGSLLGATAGVGAGFAGQKYREAGDKDSTIKSKADSDFNAVQSAQKNQVAQSKALPDPAAGPPPSTRAGSISSGSGKPDGSLSVNANHDADVRKTVDANVTKNAQNTQQLNQSHAPEAVGTHSGIFSNENRAARGAALDSAGQAISQVPSSVVDLMDKTYGGAHEADMAKIQSKYLDVAITGAKSVQDNTKAAKDKSMKMVDDGFAAIKAHYDLEKSTADNIANK